VHLARRAHHLVRSAWNGDGGEGFDECVGLLDMGGVGSVVDDEQRPAVACGGRFADGQGNHAVVAAPQQRGADVDGVSSMSGMGLVSVAMSWRIVFFTCDSRARARV
jgi:hypothetical protein